MPQFTRTELQQALTIVLEAATLQGTRGQRGVAHALIALVNEKLQALRATRQPPAFVTAPQATQTLLTLAQAHVARHGGTTAQALLHIGTEQPAVYHAYVEAQRRV
jgi:hypothetical protein